MKIRPLRSIRARMVLLVTAVLLFVVVFVGVLIGFNLRNILLQEIEAEANSTLTQAAMHLEYLQKNVRTLAVQIASNEMIQESVPRENTYSDYHERDQLSRLLRTYMTQTDYVTGIIITYKDGRTFSTASTSRMGLDVNVDESWLDTLLGDDTEAFSGLVKINYRSHMDIPAVAFAMSVNDYVYKIADYARIVIFVDPEYFTDHLAQGFATAERVSLFDRDGAVIYSQETDHAGQSDLHIEKPVGSWILSTSYEREAMMHRYRAMMSTLIFVVLLFAAIMASIIVPMIRRWTAPIKRLNAMTKQVSEGNYDVQVGAVSDDEMGHLTLAFARMTESLKKNIDRQLEEEKEKGRLQMELQMARINPHFIYNTLDSVIWLASMGQNEETVKLCRDFITILQDTLHTDGENASATLGEEISLVRAYEGIQQIRYEGRFSITYDLDPAADAAVVPKLFLQPIVENALYHGVLPNESRSGIITVKTRADGGRVEIEVSDNGVGMTEERMNNLNRQDYVAVKSQLHSIGLSNIRKRLDLMYPGQYSFHMSGGLSEGTKITIRVPGTPNGRVKRN
ncbi:MAG: histidine kinase [Clostridia bacterium]|nr:histidine kinase [Clostridia bacterium]